MKKAKEAGCFVVSTEVRSFFRNKDFQADNRSRDQCVSLEVSEGVIPRTHAIQKASHMNIVLRFVCSDSLVTKRDEKNS